MRCPRCHKDDVRLLGNMGLGVVFECLECGEVWKAVRENGKPMRIRRTGTRRKRVLVRKVKITPADLEALKRLRRIVLKKYRAGFKRSSTAAQHSNHRSDKEVHER